MATTQSRISKHLVAQSESMKAMLASVENISQGDAVSGGVGVLIEGEPGSGRELIARYLHLKSARAHLPMISVKAASASVEIFQCPLDDAEQSPYQHAHGGTLLVRDVSELRRSSQRKLTRALGPKSDWDFRVIATCDPGLEAAVEAGMFHAPLLQCLQTRRIVVPPLRDRAEDIEALMSRFVASLCRDIGRRRLRISSRAVDRLLRYPWPGNVAEMKQVARRLVVRAKGTLIEASDLEAILPTLAQRVPAEEASFEDLVRLKLSQLLQKVGAYPLRTLHEEVMSLVERPLLSSVMEYTGNNQLKTSELLGLSRNTLRRKLSDYGLVASRAKMLQAKRTRSKAKRSSS